MKRILTVALVLIASVCGPSLFAQEAGDVSTRNANMNERGPSISAGGMFIEPMLLLSQEDNSIKTSQLPVINQDTSGDSRGYGFGLRFGVHASEVFLLAIDGRYSRERTKDSFYGEANSSVYNVAPMVGVQTPLFGVRLMAGYVVSGENDPEAGDNGFNLKFKEANGWRVGAGVHVAAVAINLEYQDLNYNSTEIESVGSLSLDRTTNIDANSRGYTLSLSFPIEL